jgi:hypothetical protein
MSPDDMSIDPAAVDRLALLYAECRELGIVFQDMPLDTCAHQRMAATYLANLVYLVRAARRRELGY